MFDSEIAKELATIVGTIVAGAITSVIGLRKLARHWEKDGLEIEKVNAEESLIKTLRVESERMSKQNQNLMNQLVELQTQIGELHNSINRLRSENDVLHLQISNLNTEINDMKTRNTNANK